MAQSNQIDTVRPLHEAILNELIINPSKTRTQLALEMGVTRSWLSTVIHSDVFQAKLRERQDEFFSQATEPLRSKLMRVAEESLDRMAELAPIERDISTLRDAAKVALDALGYRKPETVSRGPAGETHNHLHLHTVSPELLAESRARIFNRSQTMTIPAIEYTEIDESSSEGL